jgi:beta-1,4-mannosyltransferase
MNASTSSPSGAPRLRIANWPGRDSGPNPFISLLGEGLAAAGADVIDVPAITPAPPDRLDALLVHWPEHVYWEPPDRSARIARVKTTIRQLAAWRATGVRLVFVVHNLQPSPADRTRLWDWFMTSFCRLVDGFVTLSPSTIAEAWDDYPLLRTTPADFIWHPRYSGATRSDTVRLRARARLDIPPGARVIAQIGFVGAYKGVEDVVRAFRATSDSNLHLLIAGQPYSEPLAAWLHESAKAESRLRLVLCRLEPDDLAAYTAAADVMVLAFTRHLHSGSMVHALCAARPVLTTRFPFASDLATEAGADWVRLCDQPLTPAVIEQALASRSTSAAPRLDALDPARAGARLIDFVARLRMLPRQADNSIGD